MQNVKSIPASKADVSASIRKWMHAENVLVSSLIEERVSNLQVARMVHAFVACTAMVVWASFSFVGTVLSLLWFGLSLYLCRKGGKS